MRRSLEQRVAGMEVAQGQRHDVEPVRLKSVVGHRAAEVRASMQPSGNAQ
jgi:hypothetical protein